MSATSDPRLPFDDEPEEPGEPIAPAGAAPVGAAETRPRPVDHAARRDAVDPLRNVVLEASAGTGKTRVLVERYVNLLLAGVDPQHILAITFTRKAAAEMRERILERMREASRLSQFDLARWRELRSRLGDIAISTIDAFCLALLREFPLEADVDPGFELADETELPRLVDASLDRALRISRALAREDDDVALVFAQLGERRLRDGLAALLERRLVAPQALNRYLEGGPRDLTAAVACQRAAARLRDLFQSVPGGLAPFLGDGPNAHPQFAMLAADIRQLCEIDGAAWTAREGPAAFRVLIDRLRAYFMTQDGRPRDGAFAGTGFKADLCASEAGWRRHRRAAGDLAPAVAEAIRGFRRDLNVVLSRGVRRVFAVAQAQLAETLDLRGLVDFAGVLERAVALLNGFEEFSDSRFRLESRFRHVLVDEFQDTSRAQWELVSSLVRSWGEGLGAAADSLSPSIFIVGDRKQSIYGFRDADVAMLDEAAELIEGLRPEGDPRRAITVSFRAAPRLQSFVNDVFAVIAAEQAGKGSEARRDAFRYDVRDRFPVAASDVDVQTPLGLIAGDSVRAVADAAAGEIVRVLSEDTVRDRSTGVYRRAQPADIAVLFRSRDSHREFEQALGRQGVASYVYKGLGFFDADEVQDALALLKYLADPWSELRAAALLRSRLARISDAGLAALAPNIAAAVLAPGSDDAAGGLDDADREALARFRAAVPGWLALADRVMPSRLLRSILDQTAYAYELRGPRWRQARENLKKLRAMMRRFENRGFATLGRVAEHLDRLAVGDEANAAIDALDAVSLMTVHASKGLEFPIVFVVNMHRGIASRRDPIRVVPTAAAEECVAIADYQSEADADAQARDREETKRLLYVALTRARDRLYLAACVKDGVCRMGRGSLGEVLPASFRALFAAAAQTPEDEVWWDASAAQRYRMRVPRS
jgi:ATP-dependent helicase/nuclease subunit A